MKSAVAQSLLNQIDVAINDIDSFKGIPSLELSYLAKFLVVFICGIYEEAIEVIIREMTQSKSSKEVTSYVSKMMERTFRNPNTDQICECLGKFDPAWTKKIRNMPTQQTAALNSIVANKNGLAHGQQISLLINEVKDYYKDSRPIIEEIDRLLL